MNCYAVIVDFSFLFHVSRSMALKAGPDYDLTEETIKNVVGKLRTVKRALEELRVVGYDLVFVEDRPALRKLALLPSYKEGRSDTSEEKNLVKQYLLQNGHITRFCHSPDNEADDAIASVLRLALTQEDLSCIIVTSDKDLWQLIQRRVQIYNPIKQTMVTDEDVRKAFTWKNFAVRPIHIALVKTLWGDAGDCVPNVVPRTQKQFLPIIWKTDGRLDSFKTEVEANKWYITPRSYELYTKAEAEILRNYQLVKLDEECALVWE